MKHTVYFDTNVFVTAFETTGMQSEWAWKILDAVTRGDVAAQTSELTLAELLPRPVQLRSEFLVELYQGLIQTGGFLSVTAVTRPILVRSAEIRAAYPATRLPDAIHITTALETGCAALVSEDRLLRIPVPLSLIPLGLSSLELIGQLDP